MMAALIENKIKQQWLNLIRQIHMPFLMPFQVDISFAWWLLFEFFVLFILNVLFYRVRLFFLFIATLRFFFSLNSASNSPALSCFYIKQRKLKTV